MKLLTYKTLNNQNLYKKATAITEEEAIDWYDMIDYCKNNRLQWLALPQIDISKRWFVAYFLGQRNIIANPKIINKSNTMVTYREWCASIPWETFTTNRHHTIIAEYDNAYHIIPYPDSIVFQHEYDHLEWILLNSK